MSRLLAAGEPDFTPSAPTPGKELHLGATLGLMEITQDGVRGLLMAAGITSAGAVEVPRRLLVKALASIVRDSESLTGPGICWVGPGAEFNSLVRDGTRLVHARIVGDRAEAAAYGSPVDTLEAVDIEESTGGWGELEWVVRTWRVTLLDGTVITIRAGEHGNPDKMASFVREHLQPGAAD